jgi:hypothetical protein
LTLFPTTKTFDLLNVKENADQKLNYCIRILGEHGNFNRLSFGDALWHSVLRPSVSHGSSVWFPSPV